MGFWGGRGDFPPLPTLCVTTRLPGRLSPVEFPFSRLIQMAYCLFAHLCVADHGDDDDGNQRDITLRDWDTGAAGGGGGGGGIPSLRSGGLGLADSPSCLAVAHSLSVTQSYDMAVASASDQCFDACDVQRIREHVLMEFGLERFSHSGHFVTKLPISALLTRDASHAYVRKLTRALGAIRVPQIPGMGEAARQMQARIARLENFWKFEQKMHRKPSLPRHNHGHVDDGTTDGPTASSPGGVGRTQQKEEEQNTIPQQMKSTLPDAQFVSGGGSGGCQGDDNDNDDDDGSRYVTARLYFSTIGVQTRPRFTFDLVGRLGHPTDMKMLLGNGPNGGHIAKGMTWRSAKQQQQSPRVVRANSALLESVVGTHHHHHHHASSSSSSTQSPRHALQKQRIRHLENYVETLPELILDGEDMNRVAFVRGRRDSEINGFLGELVELNVGMVIACGYTHAHPFDNIKTYEHVNTNFAHDEETGNLVYTLMDPRCPTYQVVRDPAAAAAEGHFSEAASVSPPVLGASRDFFNYFGDDRGDDGVVWERLSPPPDDEDCWITQRRVEAEALGLSSNSFSRPRGQQQAAAASSPEMAARRRARTCHRTTFRDYTGCGPTLEVTSELVLSSDDVPAESSDEDDELLAFVSANCAATKCAANSSDDDDGDAVCFGKTLQGNRFNVYALVIRWTTQNVFGFQRRRHAHRMFVLHMETIDQSPACLSDAQVNVLLEALMLTKRRGTLKTTTTPSSSSSTSSIDASCHLPSGSNVFIHCAGGIGRTGNIAYGLMDLFLHTCPSRPEHRLAFLRQFRPGALQSPEQWLDGVLLQRAVLDGLRQRVDWMVDDHHDDDEGSEARRFARRVRTKLRGAMLRHQ